MRSVNPLVVAVIVVAVIAARLCHAQWQQWLGRAQNMAQTFGHVTEELNRDYNYNATIQTHAHRHTHKTRLLLLFTRFNVCPKSRAQQLKHLTSIAVEGGRWGAVRFLTLLKQLTWRVRNSQHLIGALDTRDIYRYLRVHDMHHLHFYIFYIACL